MTGDASTLAHVVPVEDDAGAVAHALEILQEHRVRRPVTVLTSSSIDEQLLRDVGVPAER